MATESRPLDSEGSSEERPTKRARVEDVPEDTGQFVQLGRTPFTDCSTADSKLTAKSNATQDDEEDPYAVPESNEPVRASDLYLDTV